MRPGPIQLIRVLFLVSGFISIVNGVIELAPGTRPIVQAIGIALVVVGAASWALVWQFRHPTGWLSAAAMAVVTAIIVVRVWQVLEVGSPAILGTLILPVVVTLRLRTPAVRDWLALSDAQWSDQRAMARLALAGRSVFHRRVATLGAVGITIAALAVVVAGGTVAATVPCGFPPVSEGALSGQADASVSSMKPSGYFDATDGTRLAYFAFVPARPKASLVFYHGSGANSRAGYLGFARTLEAKYDVAVYLIDMRGHGASGGARGDAPTPAQVWQDSERAVDLAHTDQPAVPLYIGGHSSGAGVVLNSETLVNKQVAGYIFLAPDFGLHSGTEQRTDASNFATVCQRPFIVNAASNGLLDGHSAAVSFAYTREQIRSAGLVNRYTVNMSLAQNAATSATVLGEIHKPIGIWIGSRDEVFSPSKVFGYAKKATHAPLTLGTIPGATHLGIINAAAASVGEWIDTSAKR